MRNVEIKLQVDELESYAQRFRNVRGVVWRASLHEVDTYFNSSRGRLKLREITGTKNRSELLYYEREDADVPRLATYNITPVSDPAEMKLMLSAALGVRNVVTKHREVYRWRNVRIHLDDVEGLGRFIELEVMLCDEEPVENGEKLMRATLARLGLEGTHAIECSYVDLECEALQRGSQRP